MESEVRWNSESSQEAKTDDQIGAANLNRLFGPWPCLQEVAKRGVPNLTIHYMQIARLFLRVSTAEQNLAPQACIEHRAHYIAGARLIANQRYLLQLGPSCRTC